MSQSSLTLEEGSTGTLNVTNIQPTGAEGTFTWVSDAPEKADVDQSGKVTAKAAGSANINVSCNDITKTCAVTINPKQVAVTSVSVSPTEATIAPKGTQQLTATIEPPNATNQKVTWSSDHDEYATVNAENGLVTGVADGTAIITVTTEDGNKTAQSTITVQTAG